MGHDPHAALADSLAAVAGTQELVCRNHSQESPDALCADCAGAFCWSCLLYELETDSFRCPACRQAREQRRPRERLLALLRNPSTYVIATVLVAAVCYLLGVGNPSAATMAREDAGKRWHRQRLGFLWLSQGVRAVRRADVLLKRGDTETGRRWATLAHRDLRELVALWADSPVAAELRLVEADVLSRLDPAAALAELKRQAPTFEADTSCANAFLYHQGRIALKAGDRALAEASWNRLLARLDSERTPSILDLVGNAASMFAIPRSEEAMKQTVKALAGTHWIGFELQQRVLAEADEAKLKLKRPAPKGLAALLAGHDPSEAETDEDKDDKGEHVKPKPAAAQKKPLVIEHFEDR